MVDMDAVIRRGVHRAMLQKVARSDPKEYVYVSTVLRKRRDALNAAFREILGSLPRDRPNIFLVPGRSGRFLFRLFWEYVRDLKREGEETFEHGRPVALTLPLRPRRIYAVRDGRMRSPPAEDVARVMRSVTAVNPLYSRVFSAARQDRVNLIYLDPYEYTGKTRRSYELLARLYGVPENRIHAIVLNKSQDLRVQEVAELIDAISSHASWLDLSAEHRSFGSQEFQIQRYVRPSQSAYERGVWW